MNSELNGFGIKSTALCPAFVDTPMTDYIKEHLRPEDMIRPQDVAEAVRYPSFLLLTAGFFVCGFHIAAVAVHLPAFLAGKGFDRASEPLR